MSQPDPGSRELTLNLKAEFETTDYTEDPD
jgi:hypothetical protein